MKKKKKKKENSEVPNEALEDIIIDFRLSLNFSIFFGGLILWGKLQGGVMSHTELIPKCLPSHVAIKISTQLPAIIKRKKKKKDKQTKSAQQVKAHLPLC